MNDSESALLVEQSNNDNVPPPESVKPDASFPADQVRIRLSPKRSLFRLGKKRHASQGSTKRDPPDEPPSVDDESAEDPLDMPFVQLGDTVVYSEALEEDYTKDVYRWAILYENQRGITLFSTPYYSRLSLLPLDPPAFTIPSSSKFTRHSQPTVSLTSYPLPDGNWRWVSRAWMVDMRGDGQTQYDGFEYNWAFRTKHWRCEVGTLSAGGWVRRRRWVRLMMRPANVFKPPELTSTAPTPHLLFQHIIHLEHHEAGMTRPPSVAETEGSQDSEDDSGVIWQGDVEDDWERCHAALRKLGTDGRQLELWKHWLDLNPSDDKGKRTAKQWTEDEHPPVSSELIGDLERDALSRAVRDILTQPDKHYISAVLRVHGSDIFQLFIYPDSRTQFVEILARAGLLQDFGAEISQPCHLLDFYSSSQSLQNMLAAQ